MTYHDENRQGTATGRRFTIEVTEEGLECGADLLRRWLLSDPIPTSQIILKELVAEVIARVSPSLETTEYRALLRHDRSLYRSPEL